MNRLRPRALCHHGVIEAAGFYMDPTLEGAREVRARILGMWTPGCRLYRVGDGFVIRLSSPVRVECDRSPGVPLIHLRGVLLASPLATDEWKTISPPINSVVLVRGSEVILEPLADSQLEAIENWLDVGTFKLADTNSLGDETLQGPRVIADRVTFDARSRLEGVPQEAPELAQLMADLRSGVDKGDRGSQLRTDVSGGFWRIVQRIAGLSSQTKSLLRSMFGGGRSGGGQRGGRSGAGQQSLVPAGQRQQSLAERIAQGLRTLRTRFLIATRISRLIGGAQARYLQKMMAMFESGDMIEALRHAIPLGGKFETEVLRPALRPPTRRASLTISPQATRAGSSIYMGDDILQYLRNLYRASFERLEAQGRIEEAAFVLAELLMANEEAVAFLERHGRLRLAAEMAEARELAPGLIVRQWFVAGDIERATQIARRTGAFSDAVMRLERGDRKRGQKLRLLWAATLADVGDYVAAVDAIWPVEEGRRLALGWLDSAIELGGAAGARALARKLSIAPEEFEPLRDRASELLEDESVEGAQARVVFADALRHGTKNAQTQAVARMAVRAALRDSSLRAGAITNIQFRHLIDFSGDGALRSDAPARLAVLDDVPLVDRDTPLQFTFSESDSGSAGISEAVFLPNGQTLVALGEAGVRLLNRDSKTVAHFDAPAERLVISDHGDRAIAMMRRGEVWKLGRLDLLARRSEDWCEAQIDGFASDYDGSMWFIGARGDFYAIDASAKRFDALWRVPDVGEFGTGGILVARSQTACKFVTNEWGSHEEWAYELPALRLRGRTQLKLRRDHTSHEMCLKSCLALAPDGGLVDQGSYAELLDDEARAKDPYAEAIIPYDCDLRLFLSGVLAGNTRVGSKDCDPGLPAISGTWVASPVFEDGHCLVRLIDRQKFVTRLEVSLERCETVLVRLTDEWLSVVDDRGRLLVFDLISGLLTRNLRL